MARVKKAPQPEEVQATIRELVRRTLREALEAKLEEFLGCGRYKCSDTDNSRNGYNSKTIKNSSDLRDQGSRDRKGDFEPQIEVITRKERRKIVRNLKRSYEAATLEAAERELEAFSEK